jgi:hypothetical protein
MAVCSHVEPWDGRSANISRLLCDRDPDPAYSPGGAAPNSSNQVGAFDFVTSSRYTVPMLFIRRLTSDAERHQIKLACPACSLMAATMSGHLCLG